MQGQKVKIMQNENLCWHDNSAGQETPHWEKSNGIPQPVIL